MNQFNVQTSLARIAGVATSAYNGFGGLKLFDEFTKFAKDFPC